MWLWVYLGVRVVCRAVPADQFHLLQGAVGRPGGAAPFHRRLKAARLGQVAHGQRHRRGGQQPHGPVEKDLAHVRRGGFTIRGA